MLNIKEMEVDDKILESERLLNELISSHACYFCGELIPLGDDITFSWIENVGIAYYAHAVCWEAGDGGK